MFKFGIRDIPIDRLPVVIFMNGKRVSSFIMTPGAFLSNI